MSVRSRSGGLGLVAVGAFLLACGCGASGSISGRISYPFRPAGTHRLHIWIFDARRGIISDASRPLKRILEAGVDDAALDPATGVAYTFSNVPVGSYYVVAYWDVNDNGRLDFDVDAGVPLEPVVLYGGVNTDSALPVAVGDGEAVANIDMGGDFP